MIRYLVYVYEQQTAWVRWGDAKSSCFGITNGTRQGSVLSPAFFAIYIDDLLGKLRQLGVGCHIGDKFLGAAGFADDIVLLAPSRGAMEIMLATCERFAAENNLKFSTKLRANVSTCVGNSRMSSTRPLSSCMVWTCAVHLGHEQK